MDDVYVSVVYDKEVVYGVFTDPEVAREQCKGIRDTKKKNGSSDTRVWCVSKIVDRPAV